MASSSKATFSRPKVWPLLSRREAIRSAALTMTLSAFACGNAVAAGWTDVTKIRYVQAGSSGATHVYVDSAENKNGCAKGGWYLTGPAVGDGSKQVLATVLTARTMGFEVRFYSSKCSADGYNTLDFARIQPDA